MRSTFQITLFFAVLFVAYAAPRQKRQFDQSQRDPQFWQQVPQFGEGRNPQQNSQFGQQNPQFGQQNPQFGQQNPQFGQQRPTFGQQNLHQGQQSFDGNPSTAGNHNLGQQFGQNQDPILVHGQFVGFGSFQPNNMNAPAGNGLTLGANGGRTEFRPTQAPPSTRRPSMGLTIPGQNGIASGTQNWAIASRPTATTPRSGTTTKVRTTPSQSYLRCLGNCPTTMEYNPVCGNDGATYHNEQRLTCANKCGNNVSIVRRGACM